MVHKDPEKLEAVLSYHFKDRGLLRTALTHSSYANECMTGALKDNERLEFLGDAVLEAVTSDELFRRYPQEPEGALSKRRVALVCEQNLDRCARQFGLQDYLYLGKGEEKTGGRRRASVISDAMEALIGAVYLDGGYDAASSVIRRLILEVQLPQAVYQNDKSALQELLQADGSVRIEYRADGSSGPDHDKTYYVNLYVNGEKIARGSGHSKKAAEQQAAHKALEIYRAG